MRYLLTSALLLLTASCSRSPQEKIDAANRFSDPLNGTPLVYSSNLEGEIEPCGCRSNPTGGMNRRYNLLLSKIQGEQLHVDSGDSLFQSTPAPELLRKQWNLQALAMVEAFNTMKLDAFTPGELDFALGLGSLLDLEKKSKFAFVSCNLVNPKTRKPIFKPYVILTKRNRKIGITGVFDEKIRLPSDVEAQEAFPSTREIVKKIRKQVDVVLVLSHLGIENDQKLAKEVDGIDIIVGAHTRSFLNEPVVFGNTLIFQTSFRGQHIGIFKDGKNSLYQMDTRFDSEAGKENSIDRLMKTTKEKIKELNLAFEKEMSAEINSTTSKEIQTVASCVNCHAVQFEFHQKTKHFDAYQTLVDKKQNYNLDCLKCHTVGALSNEGWQNPKALVIKQSGATIDPENFASSLKKMKPESVAKVSKAFINVQCENCHGPAGGHPFSGKIEKEVKIETCLACHTKDRAPNWYQGELPNTAKIKEKLKSLSCPR